MTPKCEAFIIVQKPTNEVFDSVYNPKKLSGYFVTKGASAPMNEGTTVQWEFADFPGPFPVKVKQVTQDKQITFEWGSSENGPDGQGPDNVVTVMFEALNPQETKVTIKETGWTNTQKGMDSAFGNCMGWSQMLCAMKAYLEYGINLRKGAYKPLADS